MKALRYLALAVSLFALGSSLASSQSLADLAKKEKERRKENQAESKTVITDRELTQGYGRLPSNLPRQTETQTAEGEEVSGAEDATPGGEDAEETVDETKTPEYWQGRVKGTKEKIARLEQQLQADDWGEGQRYGVDPRGMNNLERRGEAEQQLAAAKAELEAIREEARRAGAPAGWTR